MKNLFTQNFCYFTRILVAFCLLLPFVYGVSQPTNPKYDKQLADSLGADDYGMKMYTLVILKSGSVKFSDKKVTDSLFSGHMQNIDHLVKSGKLVAAGPIKKNDKNYEGIVVLNVKTIEEANVLLEADPAIRSKLLDTELFQWYSSAALPLYVKFHDNVQKKGF
jgi:uncharacterized protein YciI